VASLPQAVPDAETRARLQSLGYASGAPVPVDDRKQPSPQEMAPLFRRFEEAHERLLEGKAAEAAAALGQLVREDRQNSVFVGTWAQALRAAGQREPAIQAYLRATELSPNDGQAWYNLGVALREAGRIEQASQALLEALRRDPRDAEAQNGLGVAESMRGNTAAAREAFGRAVELDPRNAAAQNNLGNALRSEGRLEDAAAAYRQAIAVAPDYADALNGLGVLEVGRNRPADGIPLLQRALTLAPGEHEIQLNLGVAYELLGDRAQAIATYRDFLRAAATDPQFAPQRAAVRQRLKNLGASAGGP